MGSYSLHIDLERQCFGERKCLLGLNFGTKHHVGVEITIGSTGDDSRGEGRWAKMLCCTFGDATVGMDFGVIEREEKVYRKPP